MADSGRSAAQQADDARLEQVADDFVDKDGWQSKLGWVAMALVRFGLALAIALVFFAALGVLDLRYQAEKALGGDENAQQQLHQLVNDEALRTQAANFAAIKARQDTLTATIQSQEDRLARAVRRLQSDAQDAGCGDESVSVSQARTCSTPLMAFAPELQDAQKEYDEAQKARRDVGVQVRHTAVAYDAAVQTPGAAYAAAAQPLGDFVALRAQMPAWAQPAATSVYGWPSDLSYVLLAFLAGSLGAACLLFILIIVPLNITEL